MVNIAAWDCLHLILCLWESQVSETCVACGHSCSRGMGFSFMEAEVFTAMFLQLKFLKNF